MPGADNQSKEMPDRFAYVESPAFISLGRAAELQNSLFKDLREWEEAHEAQGRVDIAPDRMTALVSVEFAEHPMKYWVPRLEDVLHHLRVTLDRLAFDIAKAHCMPALSDKEERGVYFPLFLTEAEFDAKVQAEKGWLSKLDPEYVRRFKLTQPFQAGEPKHSILYWAHTYENRTKHRLPMDLRHVYDEAFPVYFYEGDVMYATLDDEPFRVEWLGKRHPLSQGLPLFKLHASKKIKDLRIEMIPTAHLIIDEDLEADNEETFFKLHAQVLGAVFALYEGFLPPLEEVLYAPGSPMAEHRELMTRIWGPGYHRDWNL